MKQKWSRRKKKQKTETEKRKCPERRKK